MIYYFVIIVAFVFICIENRIKSINIKFLDYNTKICLNKVLLFILLTLLFFLCAFKSNSIGIDTKSYLMLYNYSNSYFSYYLSNLLHPESLFHLFMYICKIFHLSFHQFLFIYYLIIYILLFNFINRYSENKSVSVICFIVFGYLSFFMSGIRQALAIILGLCFFDCIFRKKLLKSIILYILAIGFHKSAFILFPAFFLLVLKLKKENLFSIGIILLIGSFFIPNDIIVMLVNSIGYDTYDAFVGSGSNIILVLIHLFMCIAVLFINKQNSIDDEVKNKEVYLMLIGTIIYVISLKLFMLSRMAYYFQIIIIVVYGNILLNAKTNMNHIFKFAMIVCLIFYYVSIDSYDGLHTKNYKTYLLDLNGDSVIYEEN